MRKFLSLNLVLILLAGIITGCAGEKSHTAAPSEVNNQNQTNNKTVGNSVPNGAESSAGSTEATESGSNSGEGNGESAGANISVTPPEGWEPADNSPHLAEYTKGTASFMVMKEFFDASNPDELVQQAKSAFKGTFRNIEFIGEAESITVGGKDARKLVFTCDGGNAKVKYEYVFIILGKDPYSIHFVDTNDSFDKLTGDFEQILEPISFN
jgi:hypothetical protein